MQNFCPKPDFFRHIYLRGCDSIQRHEVKQAGLAQGAAGESRQP